MQFHFILLLHDNIHRHDVQTWSTVFVAVPIFQKVTHFMEKCIKITNSMLCERHWTLEMCIAETLCLKKIFSIICGESLRMVYISLVFTIQQSFIFKNNEILVDLDVFYRYSIRPVKNWSSITNSWLPVNSKMIKKG